MIQEHARIHLARTPRNSGNEVKNVKLQKAPYSVAEDGEEKELEGREKGCKTLSSGHDNNPCNHDLTGAVVTCTRPAQDWACPQPIFNQGRAHEAFSLPVNY